MRSNDKYPIWKSCGLLFLVILLTSGCSHNQTGPTVECEGAHLDQISAIENFEESSRNLLRDYVELSDELTELQEKSLSSLVKLDDYPLYSMHYYADYNYDEYIKSGIYSSHTTKIKTPKCTCFCALNKDGEIIYGRNFDYFRIPLLILFTHPQKGYSSVAITPVGLAYSNKNLHEAANEEKRPLLYAPYFPIEGMNEHGFAIAELEIEGVNVFNDEKASLPSLHIVRLLLDQAKTIDDAIGFLKKYNNRDSNRIHYLIADASGNSAVIEYYDGDLVITKNSEPWQVSTNFLILNKSANGLLNKCTRYKTAYNSLKQKYGNANMNDALTILKNVSVPCRTQHSIVYNLTNGKIDVTVGRNYDKIFDFNLRRN